MKLYAPSTIKEIKDRYGFRLSKSLGQNFLTDKNIIDKIIAATEITDEDLVIEIGPGIGVLTYEAAQRAKQVTAIEIDKNLIPILEDTLHDFDNVDIVNQDVLKTDLNRIIDDSGCRSAKIIGNLPYYITTPIIMAILESGVHADSITIMMQKEVAVVPKEVFFPVPKVDSAVLRLDIRKDKPVELIDERMFFRCIKAGFGQRRKTLSNSLMGIGDVTKEEVKDCLSHAGIDEKRRAETLSLDEFASLANYFSKRE